MAGGGHDVLVCTSRSTRDAGKTVTGQFVDSAVMPIATWREMAAAASRARPKWCPCAHRPAGHDDDRGSCSRCGCRWFHGSGLFVCVWLSTLKNRPALEDELRSTEPASIQPCRPAGRSLPAVESIVTVGGSCIKDIGDSSTAPNGLDRPANCRKQQISWHPAFWKYAGQVISTAMPALWLSARVLTRCNKTGHSAMRCGHVPGHGPPGALRISVRAER
jgi:hypothetical protein